MIILRLEIVVKKEGKTRRASIFECNADVQTFLWRTVIKMSF